MNDRLAPDQIAKNRFAKDRFATAGWLRAICWLTFAITMYLIFQEAVRHWIKLPNLGNIGFTLVFVVFAITHCVALEGARLTGIFFAVSAVVSYLMEEAGVRTGFIYGAYHYSDLLGPKLGDVPVIIPLAWFMMIYPSWRVARTLLRGIDCGTLFGITAQAAVAAIVMTSWDVVMDPGMALDGNWTWEKGGAYFGVPRHNYLGWLATTFLVYWIAGWVWRGARNMRPATHAFKALPILVYAFLALRYIAANRFPALQLVALFSMGTPGLVALLHVFTAGSEPLRPVRPPAELAAVRVATPQ